MKSTFVGVMEVRTAEICCTECKCSLGSLRIFQTYPSGVGLMQIATVSTAIWLMVQAVTEPQYNSRRNVEAEPHVAQSMACTWAGKKAFPGVWPLGNEGKTVPITVFLLAPRFACRRLGRLNVSTYLIRVLYGLRNPENKKPYVSSLLAVMFRTTQEWIFPEKWYRPQLWKRHS